MLTYENPPKELRLMTRAEIAEDLRAHPKEWAVVYRPDRVARANAMAEKVNDGREFGDGFEATVRAVGDRSDVRVYARFTGRKARR